MAFTEYGMAPMLSSVLNSERAIEVNPLERICQVQPLCDRLRSRREMVRRIFRGFTEGLNEQLSGNVISKKNRGPVAGCCEQDAIARENINAAAN